MPTSSRPRRAAALTALTVGGALLLGTPAAVAAPGDNGDIRIHMAGTAAEARATQPKACRLYLDAFNFDVAQGVNWTIQPRSAQAGAGATLTGVITLANGEGVTENMILPAGQYTLEWTVVGGTGAPREKAFTSECPDLIGVPNGGPPAGGGGLARAEAFTPVTGAAAVGVAAVGGAVWFRLRRRPHGAA
ncbi:hypothetical protein [Streptomyces griseus]|uniref:hypothetical protein n=1 Tax=Streptomyces griseus TaxID=1911 RepID=UPI000568CD0D|nr:hypothetical protein [Streptomyces griseus]